MKNLLILLFFYSFLLACNRPTLYQLVQQGKVKYSANTLSADFIKKQGLAFFPAVVEEKTHHFLFDTGASACAIEKKIITEDNKITNVTIVDAHQQRGKGQMVTFSAIDINQNQFTETVAVVQDFSAFPVEIDNFGGIIGQSVISKANWKIDFAERKFEVSEKPFVAQNGKRIPFQVADNQLPYVSFTLEGQTVKALLDTGASTTLELPLSLPLSQQLLTKYPHRTDKMDFYTLSGKRQLLVHELKLPELQLGNWLIKDCWVSIQEIGEIRIGAYLFAGQTIAINSKKQEVLIF